MNQMAGHSPCEESGISALTWTYQPPAGSENLPSVLTTPETHDRPRPDSALERCAVSVRPLSTDTCEGE